MRAQKGKKEADLVKKKQDGKKGGKSKRNKENEKRRFMVFRF